MFKKLFRVFTLSLILQLLVTNSYSKEIPLNIAIVDDSPNLHLFFHELLTTALREDGHTPKLNTLELPHMRTMEYLENGSLSIHWMFESEERNKKYTPIKVGLTNGLVGQRILFIKKGDQHLYDNVKNIDDFRNLDLVGGFGREWFDVNVWKENNLKYKEHSGNWKSIFKMIPIRPTYNYFSRGFTEILEESKEYPELEIEDKLLFIYDRDFIFYLSKTGEKYNDIIEHALKKARNNGLVKKLVKRYWANGFKALQYDKRIKIYLKTPK